MEDPYSRGPEATARARRVDTLVTKGTEHLDRGSADGISKSVEGIVVGDDLSLRDLPACSNDSQLTLQAREQSPSRMITFRSLNQAWSCRRTKRVTGSVNWWVRKFSSELTPPMALGAADRTGIGVDRLAPPCSNPRHTLALRPRP